MIRFGSFLISCRWSLVSVCLLLVALPASAAGLLFGVHDPQVGVGQTFEVGVFLNTEGAELNAVEGSIVWPKGSFSLEGVRDGSSVVSLWVEHPTSLESGGVRFAGVLPGGYRGERGYLFSIILRADAPGLATITTTAEQLLLNDGQGTAAPLTRAPLKVTVVPQAKSPGFLPPYDAEAPEPFAPQLARNPQVFQGRWFVVFATQDKGSGLDHFEIQETQGKQPGESWVKVESPYVLRDQGLHSNLWVRAIDHAGNVRLAQLPPAVPLPWVPSYWVLVLSAIVVTLGTMFAMWFTKHRNAKPTALR